VSNLCSIAFGSSYVSFVSIAAELLNDRNVRVRVRFQTRNAAHRHIADSELPTFAKPE